jgi:hypothetical protein
LKVRHAKIIVNEASRVRAYIYESAGHKRKSREHQLETCGRLVA